MPDSRAKSAHRARNQADTHVGTGKDPPNAGWHRCRSCDGPILPTAQSLGSFRYGAGDSASSSSSTSFTCPVSLHRMSQQSTQVPCRAFTPDMPGPNSNSFSSCTSSSSSYFRNKLGRVSRHYSTKSQRKEGPQPPEERQQQKVIHGEGEEPDKNEEKVLSLSMPQIFLFGDSISLDTEGLAPRVDVAMNKDAPLNDNNTVCTEQSSSPMWATVRNKRSPESASWFSGRPIIGFSPSTRSELTCVEISPFEMPAFPSLDVSGGRSNNDEVAVQDEEDGEGEKDHKGRIQLLPKKEFKPKCSLGAVGGDAPMQFRFSTSRDDAEAERGCMKRACCPPMLFLILGFLVPFVIQEVFVVANHLATAGPILCGGATSNCNLKSILLFVFAYGIDLYIPFAFFTPALFFLSYDAVVRKEQERELHAHLSRYAVPVDTPSSACVRAPNGGMDDCPRSGGAETRDHCEQSERSKLRWDLPPCVSVLRRGFVFWVIVLTRFVFLAAMDTYLPFMTKIPATLWGPMRLVALSLPLMIYSLYETRPFLAVPYVLLDAFPLLFQLVLGNNTIPTRIRCMTGPMMLVIFERICWYVSVAAMPKDVPVGIKIVVSSTFTAIYFLLLLALSLTVDTRQNFYVTIVVAVQVLFWELLFNILLLELLARRLYVLLMSCLFQREVRTPRVQAADPTNISTQVRWPTLLVAVGAIVPFFQFHQWHRLIPYSDKHGNVTEAFQVYVATFFAVIGAIIVATIISLLIRWKHQLLRMPLLMEDWFLLLVWGCYVFSSVPLVLAAVV
ncbi:uncharacterized protein Tco025E_09697 [Trypanosoma conorhini]|uniref:Transmembrane protein n=1 Tax=Trypanosoma conorhini TaxID=83891 RepID=A0A3R7KA19_9TRYP|nr:uncharacterized protein Tco025E_09697 [Trypanosoma conorhini]RNE96568.1 hypothetical protein Tco025E_09697 [Trypanosoma conorhini]